MSEYVEMGSYGCVFRPAIPCKNNGNITQKLPTISKVFHRSSDARHEIEEYRQIVEKLDPRGKFTVKLIDNCQINRASIPESELAHCNKHRQRYTDNAFMQIIFENGGIDLEKASANNSINFETIILSALPFFKGLLTMANKKYVHNDIKTLNVVFNPNTKKVSLIDFGFIKNYDDIFSIKKYYPKYLYYPSEYEIFSFFMKESPLKIAQLYESASTNLATCTKKNLKTIQELGMNTLMVGLVDFNKYMSITNAWISKIKRKHNIDLKPFLLGKEQSINAINAFCNAYKACKLDKELNTNVISYKTRKLLKLHFDKYLNRIDVYMTGLMLIELFIEMLHKEKVCLETLEDIDIINEFINMCNHMINADAAQRYTPQQTLTHFKKIYSAMQLRHQT